MENFTPVSALVGGLLIGSSSALFLVLNVAFCEGFRTPAITDAAGCTGAGVRKPPGNEPAG